MLNEHATRGKTVSLGAQVKCIVIVEHDAVNLPYPREIVKP